MAAKLAKPGKLSFKLDDIVPVLVYIGPFCLWQGLQSSIPYSVATSQPERFWFSHGLSAIGTVLLTFGLTIICAKQRSITRRLDDLERLKN